MSSSFADEVGDILSRQLFFIAATEKSGTTWMQMMLDAHPEIACRGEGQFATKLTPVIAKALNEYSTFIDGLNKNVFSETGGFPLFDAQDRVHLVRTAAALLLRKYAADARILGEKTPGNIRALSPLRAIFPGCKFVLMVRDVRDIVVSGHVHLRRQHGDAGEEAQENYARRVAKVWADDVSRAQAFMATEPEACIQVRYEDLHRDAGSALKPVLAHVGASVDDATLNAVIEAGRFEHLSGGRKRGEEDAGSQFRKGIVGDWIGVLSPASRQAVAEAAGSALIDMGYAENDEWVGDDEG